MTFLRNLAINAHSALNQRAWLREGVARVERERHDLGAPLARAFRAVLDDEYSDEELECFRRVEALRRTLLTTFRPLEAVDFGAGIEQGSLGSHGASAGRPLRTTVARSALSSKSPFWARLLFKVVRETRPRRCLELGTNLGISASYLASGLSLNGGGSLVTLEGAESRARLARQHLEHLCLRNTAVITGRFEETLPGVLQSSQPMDFVFIDGHHDEAATKEYFRQITGHASGTGLVVLDDISWSDGMQRAWNAVRADPRVALAVDLRVLGFCLLRMPDVGR